MSGHFYSILLAALLACTVSSSFASVASIPKHIQFILSAIDLVSSSDQINPFARAYARTFENQTWTVLGDTELMYDDNAPWWRTVFVQDVEETEGREWAFEIYDSQGNDAVIIGRAGPLPANDFVGENDDMLTIPMTPSGSLILRNCRTFWNLCGLTSASKIKNV